jgi:hypothetical protein
MNQWIQEQRKRPINSTVNESRNSLMTDDQFNDRFR